MNPRLVLGQTGPQGNLENKVVSNEVRNLGTSLDTTLVYKAFSTVKGNLFEIRMFHTDRGSEFDNTLIDGLLESSRIDRSLSMKGCPYDNAVAESTFKMIKAEFVSCRRFDTLDQLGRVQ